MSVSVDFKRSKPRYDRPVPLLTIDSVRCLIGTRTILDDVRATIDEGERVGLVGRNGAGKSTLMRVIAGEVRPDSGQAAIQRGRRVAYLSQEPRFDPSRTMREEAMSAFTGVARARTRLEEVYHAMERAEGEDLRRLMSLHAALEREVEPGYSLGHKVERVLHGLGFTDEQMELEVGVLSGGQRARVGLAKLLLEEPDLLLLDEPTNHLDISGREWLEAFLAEEYAGAVLVVSHDRYLLDRVVTRILEVEDGRLIEYPGNYEDFREIRARRRLTQARAFENQQAKFRSEEAFIRRYRAGQRAKQARGRETRLERAKEQERIERPAELDAMVFELPEPARSGDLVVVMNGGSIVHPPAEEGGGEKVLFRGLDLKIARGERWGIIGPNGAGKTSLVRAMLGEQALTGGTVRLGTNVSVGYFRQTHEHADPSLRVYEYLQRVIRKENPGTTVSEQRARDLAGAFLFTGREQDKTIGQLSGGERSRALLAALLASSKNLLILDEPTNHLDIPSAERLEDALARDADGKSLYTGTVLLISHDRALIDAVCDHLIVLDGEGGATVFPGGYTEWTEREAKAAEPVPAAKPAAAPRERAPSGPSKRRPYSWMSVEQLEGKIEALEGKIREVDEALSGAYSDVDRYRSLSEERGRLAGELAGYEEEWLLRG